MKTFSRVRRALILAAVLSAAALSGAFVPAKSVSSKPARPVYYAKEITYYSDASYTNVVGVGMIYCNGRSTLEGTSTQYRTEQITDVCCGSVPC